MIETYPVTIIKARYGGSYEGGKFIAFNEHIDTHIVDDAEGDDITSAMFFDSYSKLRNKPIGKGNTPDEAYHDLQSQLADQENEESA
jgi:hypothetical protein